MNTNEEIETNFFKCCGKIIIRDDRGGYCYNECDKCGYGEWNTPDGDMPEYDLIDLFIMKLKAK